MVKQCEVCGFDQEEALVIHHRDGDPTNNSPEIYRYYALIIITLFMEKNSMITLLDEVLS